LVSARERGRIGGRPPKLTAGQEQEIIELVHSGQKTGADAAKQFKVHPATVSRLLNRGGVP
jgi:transposase